MTTRQRRIKMLQELLNVNPGLRAISRYYQNELSENEKDEVFQAFDENEFLAYDLLGAIKEGDLRV